MRGNGAEWKLGGGSDDVPLTVLILPVVIVMAVPIRADDRVAGRWRSRGRHRVGKDTRVEVGTTENHLVELLGEDADLGLERVDDGELGGEVVHGSVDVGSPDRELLGGSLHAGEAVAQRGLQAIDAGFHRGKALAKLLRLVKEKLRVGIHRAAETLKSGVVVVGRIQEGRRNTEI